MPNQTAHYFNLEQEGLASYNYFEKLVDPKDGFTCFNVFLTDPAEAVHDWPDFLDVPGRSAESCVLLRHMTGRGVATEDLFFQRILSFQEADGLFRRPETELTHHQFYGAEQALVMAALLARVIGDNDSDCQARLERFLKGLNASDSAGADFPFMLIRPLTRAWEALGNRTALELVQRMRTMYVDTHPLFRADGSFAGHVHSQLYAAAGLAELGRVTGDGALIEAMDRVYQVIRRRSTDFGWVPELAEREDDVVGCETCCLMDYIHLALSLARCGHTEYYDDVERAVRNHLSESRVRSSDWLPESPGAKDEGLILRQGLREKVIGAYGGWSCPNHMLAYHEFLPAAWLKTPDLNPIFLNKVRALQNCCSPSGPKAMCLAWQHASRVAGGRLQVNLLMDRSLPEADVRGYEPWEGKVEVTLHKPMRIALRMPGFVKPGQVRAHTAGQEIPCRQEGNYLVTEAPLAQGTLATFEYPLAETSQQFTIGNEGYQQYQYTARWRGATVLAMTPAAGNPATGRSHMMKEPVRLYYGEDGPHPLYQRASWLQEKPDRLAVNTAAGPDIW